MILNRALDSRTLRRTTLAAGLAAALAAGANAAGPAQAMRDTGSGNSVHSSAEPHDTIIVDTCADDGSAGSLRGAIMAAQDGDTIDLSALACSPITLSLGEIGVTAANLVIQGPGQDQLTISGNDANRVFRADGRLDIRDVTIASGHNVFGDGGCLRVDGDLALTRSLVTDCVAGVASKAASFGGGAHVRGNLTMTSSTIGASYAQAEDFAFGGGAYVYGDATLTDSTIAGNIAASSGLQSYARGGGVFVKGDLVLSGVSVDANAATSVDGSAYGGGIYGDGAQIIVESVSTITGNLAHSDTEWAYGGGIGGGQSGTAVYLTASTLSGNTVTSGCADCFNGGGGVNAFGLITAYDSTIDTNIVRADSAYAFGGGLRTFDVGHGGAMLLVDTTVSGNSAIGGGVLGNGLGGGLAVASGNPFFVVGSTIAFNVASDGGGGILGNAPNGGPPALISSIVANNDAASDADIASDNPAVPLVIGGAANLVVAAGAGVTLPADTITDAPQLLPLADNGGATKTHAIDFDSPALDHGDNTIFPRGCDQRGAPHARVVGPGPDIGAFELQPHPDAIFASGFETTIECL